MCPCPADHAERMARARLALEGLSLGDAFGERFFGPPQAALERIAARTVPAAPWGFTDDTVMALSVVEVLAEWGGIAPDQLARAFARRYAADPARGYGRGAHEILQAVGAGADWRTVAGAAFGGTGSMGNGGAMRVAPVGGYFAGDLDAAVPHARHSAQPTHAHPEGEAGAIAVTVAAAVASTMGTGEQPRSGAALLAEAFARTPNGPTREGIDAARQIDPGEHVSVAAQALGTGQQVISSDTVPFSLWCAARHLGSFEEAMWATVSGLGDRDTTCAIVGGIVALSVGAAGLPRSWLTAREPLPP